MNISKELLSEVLDVEVCSISGFLRDGELEYQFVSDTNTEYGGNNACSEIIYPPKRINIYELANLCKEWVSNCTSTGFGYGSYYIHSSNGDSSWGHLERTPTAWIQDPKTGKSVTESFTALTEPEAIFKSALWILNNKDK